jgi:hypothetical protein
VQDRGNVVVEVALDQANEKLVLVDEFGDLAIDEVAELVGAGEIVDGNDAAFAARVQRLDEVGADESGRAGDDDVHDGCPRNGFGFRVRGRSGRLL